MRHIVDIFKKRKIACVVRDAARNVQILNSQQQHDKEVQRGIYNFYSTRPGSVNVHISKQ